MSSVAAEVGADTIIVASRPEGEPEFVKQLSWQLEGTAAELVLSSRLTDVAGPRISFAPVEGLAPHPGADPAVRRRPAPAQARAWTRQWRLWRSSTIALLAPVQALLIKLDSPGPVFFFQERVGRDGRRFKMVKFRSMKTDAEQQLAALKAQNEGAGLLFKMKDDPRGTRVGRVLRKLSLDELPQFWNVLVGDMSASGPARRCRARSPHTTARSSAASTSSPGSPVCGRSPAQRSLLGRECATRPAVMSRTGPDERSADHVAHRQGHGAAQRGILIG